MNQAERDTERRRFSRPIGTQIAKDLAWLDGKADVTQGLHVAKVLGEPIDLQNRGCGHDSKIRKCALYGRMRARPMNSAAIEIRTEPPTKDTTLHIRPLSHNKAASREKAEKVV